MNIALIAHDAKKELMIQFCIAYCGILSRHNLFATGTTGKVVAEATGLGLRTVNGVITSAFQKKNLMVRVPAEIKLEDGSHKAVKFIELTDEGRAWDPNAVAAE